MKNRKSITVNPTFTTADSRLRWPSLQRGRLIKRYKRFLADIQLDDGATITAHCPNSGSMRACCQPGQPVWVSHEDNPRRKLAYTWQLIEMPTSLVGVHTLIPNRLLFQVLSSGILPGFQEYSHIQREVATGDHSRLDIRLETPAGGHCYIEIKNCTLVENGRAMFPDAVSARGTRHLLELQRLRAEGHRAVIFFLIQRMDARVFQPADDIDPLYGQTLRQVLAGGVEIMAWDVILDLKEICLGRPLPCEVA